MLVFWLQVLQLTGMGKPFIHIPAMGTASNAALWGCSPCLQHCCGRTASPSSTVELEVLAEVFFRSKGNLIALYRSDSHNKQLCCHVPAVASCLLSAAPASLCSAMGPAAAWCLLQTFRFSECTLQLLCAPNAQVLLCVSMLSVDRPTGDAWLSHHVPRAVCSVHLLPKMQTGEV